MNVDKIIQVRLHRKPVHVASVLREGLHGLQPDLELVGEEGARLGVHSLVLASCSPALATLLATSHSCGQGSVLVPGVGSRELQSTVTLIYHGLVTVAEEDVKLVLETAKLLGIDGIDVPYEGNSETHTQSKDKEHLDTNIEDMKTNDILNYGNVCDHGFNCQEDNEVNVDYADGSDDDEDDESDSLEDIIMKDEELKKTFANELEFIKLQKEQSEIKKKSLSGQSDAGVCPDCQKDYKTRRKMRLHYNMTHSDAAKMPRICHECGKSCKNQNALIKHRLIHGPARFQCDQCDSTFKTSGNLKIHIKRHHETHSFYCDQCSFKTAMKQYLDKHIKREHQGFRIQCSECDFQTKTKFQLKIHFNRIHLKLKETCPICFKEYSGRNAVYKHCMDVHKEDISIHKKMKKKVEIT